MLGKEAIEVPGGYEDQEITANVSVYMSVLMWEFTDRDSLEKPMKEKTSFNKCLIIYYG